MGRSVERRIAVLLLALTIVPALVVGARAEEPHVRTLGETQLAWLAAPSLSADGQRIGPGAVNWGGGSWYALELRLQRARCEVQALWLPERRLIWHGAAPEFVNRAFNSAYGSGEEIAAGTLAVMCAADPIRFAAGPAEPEFAPDASALAWILRPERAPSGRLSGSAYIQYGGGTAEALSIRLSLAGCGQAGTADPGASIDANSRLWVECDAAAPLIPDYDLPETQVRWLLRPEVNTQRNKQGFATIQYGGGSFQHLVSRLSIEGCNVTELTIEGSTYNFLETNQFNQDFRTLYNTNIHKNTNIDIQCKDNCEIVYGIDLVATPSDRQIIESVEKCREVDSVQARFPFIEEYSDCGEDWMHQDDIAAVIRILPISQRVCKIDATVKEFGFLGFNFVSTYIYHRTMFEGYIPTIFIAHHKNPSMDKSDDKKFTTLVHELCHAHQNWYTFKHHIDYDFLEKTSSRESRWVSNLWIDTPMAQEFNEIVRFTQKTNGDWVLGAGGPYRSLATYLVTQPKELSAEICSWYIIDKVHPSALSSIYRTSPYLTPELEAWIEKYIVLPE